MENGSSFPREPMGQINASSRRWRSRLLGGRSRGLGRTWAHELDWLQHIHHSHVRLTEIVLDDFHGRSAIKRVCGCVMDRQKEILFGLILLKAPNGQTFCENFVAGDRPCMCLKLAVIGEPMRDGLAFRFGIRLAAKHI
jgi:hypothetical protein